MGLSVEDFLKLERDNNRNRRNNSRTTDRVHRDQVNTAERAAEGIGQILNGGSASDIVEGVLKTGASAGEIRTTVEETIRSTVGNGGDDNGSPTLGDRVRRTNRDLGLETEDTIHVDGDNRRVIYERDVEFEGRDGKSRIETEREYERGGTYRGDYDNRGSYRDEPSGDYRTNGRLSGDESWIGFHKTFSPSDMSAEDYNNRTADIVDYLNETTGSDIKHADFKSGSSAYSDMWADIANTIEKNYSEADIAAFEAGAYGAWENLSNEATQYLDNKYGKADASQSYEQPSRTTSEQAYDTFSFTENEINAQDVDRLYSEANGKSNSEDLQRFNALVENLATIYPDSALGTQYRSGEPIQSAAVAESLNFFIQQYDDDPTDRIINLKQGSSAHLNTLEHVSTEARRGNLQPYETQYDQPQSARTRNVQSTSSEYSNEPRRNDYDLEHSDIRPIYDQLRREGRGDELTVVIENLAQNNPGLDGVLRDDNASLELKEESVAAAIQNYIEFNFDSIEGNYNSPQDVIEALGNGDIRAFEDVSQAINSGSYGSAFQRSSIEQNRDQPQDAVQNVSYEREVQEEAQEEVIATTSSDSVASTSRVDQALVRAEANQSNNGRVTFEEGQAMFDAMAQQFGAENVTQALADQGIFESPSNKAMMTEFMNSLGQERNPEMIAEALNNSEIRANILQSQTQQQADISQIDASQDELLAQAVKNINFGEFAENITYSIFESTDTVSPLAINTDLRDAKGAAIG